MPFFCRYSKMFRKHNKCFYTIRHSLIYGYPLFLHYFRKEINPFFSLPFFFLVAVSDRNGIYFCCNFFYSIIHFNTFSISKSHINFNFISYIHIILRIITKSNFVLNILEDLISSEVCSILKLLSSSDFSTA